jgi:hypothetical protein
MLRKRGFWTVAIIAAAGAVLGAGLIAPYVGGPADPRGYAGGLAIGGLLGFLIGLAVQRLIQSRASRG